MVVLDINGGQVGLFSFTQALYSGNGSWIDNDRLVCAWNDENGDWLMTILNVTDGTREILGSCRMVPFGRMGDRFVTGNMDRRLFAGVELLTNDLRHQDPMPFISITPPRAIEPFDTWTSSLTESIA